MKTVHSDDPVKCAEAIIDRIGRDVVLAVPIGIGKPNRLVNALYRIAEADRRVTLKIFTGISLARPHYRTSLERRFAEPLLDRLFPRYPELLYVQALRERRLPANIEIGEFFLQAGAWLSQPVVQQSYTSLNYSHVAGYLMRAGTNAFAQLVAPHPQGDAARFSLSSNTDVTLDIMPYVAERRRQGGRWRSPPRSTPTCPICRAKPRSSAANSTCCWRRAAAPICSRRRRSRCRCRTTPWRCMLRR